MFIYLIQSCLFFFTFDYFVFLELFASFASSFELLRNFVASLIFIKFNVLLCVYLANKCNTNTHTHTQLEGTHFLSSPKKFPHLY